MRFIALVSFLPLLAFSCGGSTSAEEAASVEAAEVGPAGDTEDVTNSEGALADVEATSGSTAPPTTEKQEIDADQVRGGDSSDLDVFCQLNLELDQAASDFDGASAELTAEDAEAFFRSQRRLIEEIAEYADSEIVEEVQLNVEFFGGLIVILEDYAFDLGAASDKAGPYLADPKLSDANNAIDEYIETNCLEPLELFSSGVSQSEINEAADFLLVLDDPESLEIYKTGVLIAKPGIDDADVECFLSSMTPYPMAVWVRVSEGTTDFTDLTPEDLAALKSVMDTCDLTATQVLS